MNWTTAILITRNSSRDENTRTWRHAFRHVVLSIYLLTLTSSIRHKMDHTQVNWIQLKTFELNLTSHNIYSTLMCRLRIFAGPPIYHLPGNVISATIGFVYINLQPKYELSSSAHFGQFHKLAKIWVGAPSFPAIPKEIISAQGLSSCSWLPVR